MLALDMWKWYQQRNINISAVYISDQLNIIAKILCWFNKSQFRMEPQSSNFSSDLCNLHYPRSRPFWTRVNNQLQKFISWFPDQDAMATNAFTIPSSNLLCYAVLPYSQIMKCLKKIQSDKAKVLLLAPVWRSRPWFPILLLMLYNRPLLVPNIPDLMILLPHPGRMPQKQIMLAI